MPWITTTSDGPPNYGDAIQGLYAALFGFMSDKPHKDFNKEPAVVAILEYAASQPRLREFLVFGEQSFGSSRLVSVVADALDRYIHLTNRKDLDRDLLLPIYLPLEKYLFQPSLPVEIVVPILFLKFDSEKIQVTHTISVEQLTPEFHLSRGYIGRFGSDDNSLVEGAATHGLFIRGLSLPNDKNWFVTGQTQSDADSYPVEEIDRFFGALRIATGYVTGYAQMVLIPVNWASSYAATITPIGGPRANKYPLIFERVYWKEPVPSVESTTATQAAALYNGLTEIQSSPNAYRVDLAMRRPNLSAIRTSEEDGVIDSVIALEALLTGEEDRQEMTHKAAMRLAALYKTFQPERAMTAFNEMKSIYRFRSKIVHGSGGVQSDDVIKREEKEISVIDAIFEHLRQAFAVLIMNTVLLNPKKIDEYLLTDKF